MDEQTNGVEKEGEIHTQLLVRCRDEAFARKYIQYPFVATAVNQNKQYEIKIVSSNERHQQELKKNKWHMTSLKNLMYTIFINKKKLLQGAQARNQKKS